jgi:hypothetical protein
MPGAQDMSMIEINKNPSARELRFFGILFTLFFALIGGLLWWRYDAPTTALVLWIAAGAVLIGYSAVPSMRRPAYLGWMYAAYPIGWIVSHLILLIVYYLVLSPVGLLNRLFRRDPMQRRWDPTAATYWKPHRPASGPERYFRQY